MVVICKLKLEGRFQIKWLVCVLGTSWSLLLCITLVNLILSCSDRQTRVQSLAEHCGIEFHELFWVKINSFVSMVFLVSSKLFYSAAGPRICHRGLFSSYWVAGLLTMSKCIRKTSILSIFHRIWAFWVKFSPIAAFSFSCSPLLCFVINSPMSHSLRFSEFENPSPVSLWFCNRMYL